MNGHIWIYQKNFANNDCKTFWSPGTKLHSIHVSMKVSAVWQAHCSQVNLSQQNNNAFIEMTMYIFTITFNFNYTSDSLSFHCFFCLCRSLFFHYLELLNDLSKTILYLLNLPLNSFKSTQLYVFTSLFYFTLLWKVTSTWISKDSP